MATIHGSSIVNPAFVLGLWIIYIYCSGMVWANASGDVRLVGGAKPNEGRVEIHNDGIWGTYCGDSIDVQIGMVICRQAGYPGAAMRFQTSQEFGSGTGPVYYNGYMSCVGDERSLAYCHFTNYKYSDCTHSKDAGVICQEPGYVGCYPADGSNIQPILSLTSSEGTDSVDDCLTLCRTENTSHAAMSGKRCHCINQLPKNVSSSRVTDDKCSSTCSGNSRQICGGPNHYSVFSTTDGFCDQLLPPANGTIDTKYTRYGATVTFGCVQGFELEGAKKTQCVRSETHTSGFKWGSVAPICTARRKVPTLLVSRSKESVTSSATRMTGLSGVSDPSETTLVPLSPRSSSNPGIVIGIISGIILVAIVMTLLFIYCRQRRTKYERKPLHVRTSWSPLHIRSSWTPTYLHKGELNAEPHMYETTSQGGASLHSTPMHRAVTPGGTSEHEYASYHEFQHDLLVEDTALLHSPIEKVSNGRLTLKDSGECCSPRETTTMVVNELYNPQGNPEHNIYEITEDEFQLLRESQLLDNREQPALPRRTSLDARIKEEEHIYEPEPISELSFAMDKDHVYSSADYAYAEVDPRDSGVGTLSMSMRLRGSLPCFHETMVKNELYVSSDNVEEQQATEEPDNTVMVENILYKPQS
ncbi:uncharacterized protein LOC129281023 isoform X1 [Lytechinus pictus]|uniref:uncharacterized protein LOC129281023 isoform X1 n=1 Tax=Lytechinus pictus TaxID=7653 RepID=UPI0030B9CD4F